MPSPVNPGARPSRHIQSLDDALSIRWNTRVYELRAAGVDVTVLSLGEAFFEVPLSGLDDLPDTLHYSHSRGLPVLREQLAAAYYGVPVDPGGEIIVTAGSKIAIYLALLTMLDPGDEVIIPEPAWVSYTEQVRLCHGEPVTVPHDRPVADWGRYVTPRTRAIIVNSPNNPRGSVLSAAEWSGLHGLAERHSLYLLCDEAYSEFLPEASASSPAVRATPPSATRSCATRCRRTSACRVARGLRDRLRRLPGRAAEGPTTSLHLRATPSTMYVAEHFDELRDVTRPQIAPWCRGGPRSSPSSTGSASTMRGPPRLRVRLHQALGARLQGVLRAAAAAAQRGRRAGHRHGTGVTLSSGWVGTEFAADRRCPGGDPGADRRDGGRGRVRPAWSQVPGSELQRIWIRRAPPWMGRRSTASMLTARELAADSSTASAAARPGIHRGRSPAPACRRGHSGRTPEAPPAAAPPAATRTMSPPSLVAPRIHSTDHPGFVRGIDPDFG